jgi:site-specific recombinase XerD
VTGELVQSRQARALAAVPRLYAPNPQAAKRFIEYFAANIRNPHTRRAYFRSVREFADWCERQRIHNLMDIEPVHVAAYVEQLGLRLAKPVIRHRNLTRFLAQPASKADRSQRNIVR